MVKLGLSPLTLSESDGIYEIIHEEILTSNPETSTFH